MNYGRAGIALKIRANLRYSVDNWATSTTYGVSLQYPTVLQAFNLPISPPAVVPSGQRFSVRIFPLSIDYTSTAYASHKDVVINGVAGPSGGVSQGSFQIRKSTGAVMIPGTYLFNIMCNAPNGTVYAPVPNPVAIVLPSPGVTTISVPVGHYCNVTEIPPATGSWDPPGFTSNGVTLAASGWEAKVGPVSGTAGTVLVSNRPKTTSDRPASFVIRKSTGAVPYPGTYLFNVTCSGPGGPYTGPNPVSVVFPSPGASTVNVPAGAICGIIELPPATGSWLPPGFTGTGVGVFSGAPWEAKVGPITGNGGSVLVSNQPKR
jgi:hypothetical protein